MASITLFGFNENALNLLNTMKYRVHVNFRPKRTFDQYVENGFDPEEWENKNEPNKVLIDNVPYNQKQS
jgi:hypothetical protein